MRGAFLTVLLLAVAVGMAPGAPHADDPRAILLQHEWLGNIDQVDFNEPSGIEYHAERGTLFVVGDEGDLCEIKTDGTLVRQAHIRDGDFEGVTYDPATGLLYVAVEGEEKILEIDPDVFQVRREFALPRDFEGRTLLKPGGQGVEAIAFVPDSKHTEGGVFYIANQGLESAPPDDPSVIVEVELALRTGEGGGLEAKISRALHVGVIDIAGLHYEAASDHLYFVSDATNTLFETTLDGDLLRSWAFPARDQEGLAMGPDGYLYVAQASGGVIKLKWLRDRQASP
jgi:uncharacterized protein YjiK